jgi:multicomponent Na+:H+ antiporter subunit E
MREWTGRLADVRSALHMLPALLLLWYALSGGTGWLFGIASACAVALFGRWLAPARLLRISLPGLGHFVVYFLHRSVLGGLDVAWRALHPAMPLDTHETYFQLRFPTGQQRTLFTGTLSLLPGTLSCDLVDGRLRVHSISGNPQRELERLEVRVRSLFKEPEGRGTAEDA